MQVSQLSHEYRSVPSYVTFAQQITTLSSVFTIIFYRIRGGNNYSKANPVCWRQVRCYHGLLKELCGDEVTKLNFYLFKVPGVEDEEGRSSDLQEFITLPIVSVDEV